MISSRLATRGAAWLNLPTLSLLAFLQRTPVVQLMTSTEEYALQSPLGAVLKSALAIGASLGAVHSLAGATKLAVSPTASPLDAKVGTAIAAQAMTVTGAQTVPASFTVSGVLPPGLSMAGSTTITSATALPAVVNGATLTLSGTPTTAGTYNIGIKAWQNAGGKGDSSSVFSYSVVVAATAAVAPTITTQPQSQTVPIGVNISFSVAATGSPAPTLQWQKDGSSLSGQTGTTLSLSNVQLSEAGVYTAVATNSAGTVTSNGATLTVTATAPSFVAQPQSQAVTVGANVTFTASAIGAPTPTLQWRKDGQPITGQTATTLTLTNVQTAAAGNYTLVATNAAGTVTSSTAVLTVNPPAGTPPNVPTSLGGFASGATEVTLSWLRPDAGAAPTGYRLERATDGGFSANLTTTGLATTATSYVDTTAVASTTYYYRVSATNAGGGSAATSAVTVTTPATNGTGTASFANIATRAMCGTGNNVTIGGFVISGSASKRVLVRAVGPSLTAQGIGATEVLLDPTIEVHNGSSIVATNDNPADNANAAEIAAVASSIGASALLSTDTKSSVLLATLAPGVYSFVVKGKNDSSGVVLLEVYDADAAANGAIFTNIATRAYCTTNNGVTIGGFVVSGNARKQVLMRAVGPTLTTQGLGQTEVLADPLIELHDAIHGNVLIATNDNAADNANAAAILAAGNRIGATPLSGTDTTSAALLLTLPPGVYSFVAHGKAAAPSGVLLVEVYDAD